MMIEHLDMLANRLVPTSANGFEMVMKSTPEELAVLSDHLANAYNAVVNWYDRHGVKVDVELDLHD